MHFYSFLFSIHLSISLSTLFLSQKAQGTASPGSPLCATHNYYMSACAAGDHNLPRAAVLYRTVHKEETSRAKMHLLRSIGSYKGYIFAVDIRPRNATTCAGCRNSHVPSHGLVAHDMTEQGMLKMVVGWLGAVS